MKKTDLKALECDTYYHKYINKLPIDTTLINGFKIGKEKVVEFFKSIPQNKLNYRYQPEKWSVKEVLQHLIDTERIFMYRCFRIARRDKTALVGYDQDVYVKPSLANNKSLEELLNEFTLNRNNSIALLQSLTKDDLNFVGNANGNKMSAGSAAFIIIGHDIWHMEVINKYYL